MGPISLLYHDVVDGDPGTSGFPGADADSYKLEESNFTDHLEKIAACGAGHRVRVLSSTSELAGQPVGSILLTFDDGGVTAINPTARLLEARGWRGHFFIVTAKIDQPGFLSRAQILDLHRRGHHIGSHSHSHPSQFSKLSYAEMLDEWKESRRVLADVIGTHPISVSVPGGFFSRKVAHAARKAGYEILFNSEPTSKVRYLDGLGILGRYGIKRDTSAASAQSLARGDLAPRVLQTVLWNVKKPAKQIGGNTWFAFRRWMFEKSTSVNS